MATTFEILVAHADALYAAQAASAAFDLLDRLEQQLSRFIENSDISRINNLPAGAPAPISLDTLECLKIARRIHDQTHGAFDITVGALMDCWSGKSETVQSPSQRQIQAALQRTGMDLLELDENRPAARLKTSGVRLDLGGIGKGYAIDKMAARLRDWSIDAALIHGGRSSVLALDAPPGADGWPIEIANPHDPAHPLAHGHLRNCAVSGSGIMHKGRHIIDPRTGRPVGDRCAAWAFAPTAAEADALSTAFMVMSRGEIGQTCSRHPDVQAMVLTENRGAPVSPTSLLRLGAFAKAPGNAK